jgi:hypothetical protein
MKRSVVTAVILAGAFLVAGRPQSVRAEEPHPAIVSVRLAAEGGYVTGDVTSSGLFSERITGTVQSGLPAVVDVFYYFSTPDGGTAAENVLSFSLHYDVWEDVYSVEAPDTTLSFPTFAAMQQAIQKLHHLKLVSLDSLDPSRSYRVHMSIMINPLRGADRDEIAGWVSENMQESEDDSWHGQVLNLNELISHFFSRERGVVNRSSWYKSASIKPDSLRMLDKEKK